MAFRRLRQQPGFTYVAVLTLAIEPERVLTVEPRWRRLGPVSPERRTAEMTRRRIVINSALPRIRMLPGVEAASTSIGLPFLSLYGADVRVPGVENLPTLPGGGPYISAVGPDYFRTVGTELMSGRLFTDADGPGRERVAIVSDTMARALWPGERALDKSIVVGREGHSCFRIVGVVEDTRRFSLREDPAMHYYVPIGQETGTGIAGTTILVCRVARDVVTVAALRRELFALDSTLAYVCARHGIVWTSHRSRNVSIPRCGHGGSARRCS